MAKRVRFEGKVYNVPDDATDDEIIKYVGGQVGGASTPAPAAAAPRRPGMAPLASHPLFWAAQQGADLSSLMAAPGGFAPGPMGALASGLGGGGGELIEQLAQGRFNPAQIGGEAAKQAALGFAGAGVGKAGGYVAKQMMQGALRPVLKMGQMAPTLAEDALRQGATVGRVAGTGGLPAARKEVGKRAGETAKMLERATQATAPLGGGAIARIRFRVSALLPNADDVVGRASPHRAEELAEARELISSIAKNYKGAKTPVELKAIKQELQTRARSAYENIAAGKRFSPDAADLPISSRVYWQAANRVQKALENIPTSAAGGSIKAGEKATQKAINVAGAVKRAEDVSRSGVSQWIPQTVGRGGAAATGATIGALGGSTPEERMQRGGIGMLAGSALTHPAILSRLAYLLYNPATMGALRNAPRGIESLFTAGQMPPDTLTQEDY